MSKNSLEMYNQLQEMKKLIFRGDLEELKKLIEISGHGYSDLTEFACKYGKLDILQYLYENDYMLSNNCEFEAGRHEHIDCVRFLFSLPECDTVKLVNAALLRGNLETLKMYHENGGIITGKELNTAKLSRSNECIEYCLQHHIRDKSLFEYAAETGNLTLMREALDNDFDIGDSFNKAIKNNQLEVVKLLCEYRKVNKSHLLAARAFSRHEILRYLKTVI